MLYILSHPRLTRSSKPLAQKIGEIVGEQILVSKVPLDPRKHICIVRYGNSAPINEKEVDYNHPNHIRLAGNKANLSKLLLEKDFSHVELYYNENPEIYPIFVRTELNRGGGIGIQIVENEEQFKPFRGHAWSYYYPFKFELGVHVLGGSIKRVFKKERADGLEEEKYPIRNTQRGYEFKLKNPEIYRGLPKFVETLYNIIPIQFARLDVGYEEGEGYRLIEINSAPDLSQNKNTLTMYADFLARKVFVR